MTHLHKNQSSLQIKKKCCTTTNMHFQSQGPFHNLPSLKRHVRSLTAEKTPHCAQGYRWKLDEYLYLPAEESEDLGGGESLSAMTHTKALLCITEKLQYLLIKQ